MKKYLLIALSAISAFAFNSQIDSSFKTSSVFGYDGFLKDGCVEYNTKDIKKELKESNVISVKNNGKTISFTMHIENEGNYILRYYVNKKDCELANK